MFGFNSEQVYADEIGALNNRRTDIEFDLGDNARQIWGSLIGKDYSKEGILKGAAEAANRKLTDAYGGRANTARASLGSLASQYQGVEGKTTQEIESALAIDEARAKALQTVTANNPNFDPTKLSALATAGEIYGAGAKATQQTQKDNRDEERGYQQNLLDAANERTDKLLAAANERTDRLQERQDIREERKDERARLERLETRRLTAEQNKMQMQFEYDRLAQTERLRSQDRKDKAIAMLFQGLGNLGSAFAV